MQAALRATPQDVVGAVRPFVVYEVAQLALAQAGAVVFAQYAIADDLVGARTVAAEDRVQRRRWNPAVPGEEGIAHGDSRLLAEIASRKRGAWSRRP